MINKQQALLISLIGVIVLFSGCVSQGSYDALAKDRDDLSAQNRTLESKLTLVQNENELVTKDLESAKQRLNATNRVIIETHGKYQETRSKAITASELYNKLVSQLASELESHEVTIEQMQSGVSLNLPEAILFASGSADVKSTGENVLNKVAKELADISFQTVVLGFTDNLPISQRLVQKFPTNWDLATTRATNMAHKLENSGVAKERLVVVSLGENQPIASNDTEQGRAQNRRIEIRLRPVVIE